MAGRNSSDDVANVEDNSENQQKEKEEDEDIAALKEENENV